MSPEVSRRARAAGRLKGWAVSFGSKYAHEDHPSFPPAHPDGYLVIWSRTEIGARHLAVALLGRSWSHLYELSEIRKDPHFPAGALAEISMLDPEAHALRMPKKPTAKES